MAKKIYIGNILQDVKTSIAALQTDMATLSSDMKDMVAEMIILAENTSQNINTLKIKSSVDEAISFPKTIVEAAGLMTLKDTYYKMGTFKIHSMSEGTLTIAGNIQIYSIAGETTTVNLYKNGVSIGTLGSFTGSYVYSPDIPFSIADILVEKDDYFELWAKKSGAGGTVKVKLEIDSCSLNYELANLITDGGFAIQA